MMFTGLGPKDALTLPRNFAKGGEIATRRERPGGRFFGPCRARWRPFSPKRHLTPPQCFAPIPGACKVRVELEKDGLIGPGLTLYGLRHTVAVILRESGCDERTIADALGQKTIEMARHYAKGADLTRKMHGVVKSFDAELAKRRTEIVNPD